MFEMGTMFLDHVNILINVVQNYAIVHHSAAPQTAQQYINVLSVMLQK